MMRGRDYQMNREKGDRKEKESYHGYVMAVCGCIPWVLDSPRCYASDQISWRVKVVHLQ